MSKNGPLYTLGSLLVDSTLEGPLFGELGAEAASFMLIPQDGSSPSKLPFDWSKAKAYYSNYCSEGNDCPDGEYPLDCTHFVCHGLSKTKIIVNLPSATCSNGVCIRVAELAAAFKNAVKKYSNVKEITDFSATREGDFCFIVSWFGLSTDHAMVLADKLSTKSAKVWGHTNNRCASRVDISGQSVVVYRIE